MNISSASSDPSLYTSILLKNMEESWSTRKIAITKRPMPLNLLLHLERIPSFYFEYQSKMINVHCMFYCFY